MERGRRLALTVGGTPSRFSSGMRWFDPVSGACNYSRSVPLTFTFAGQTLPSTVLWTVEFNTSTAGYTPIVPNIGAQPCNPDDEGCGYDSLNVGAKTYPNSPYAGADLAANVAFVSRGANTLASETGWAANRPLGQIVLGP